jgi:hypothetical protein
MTEEGRMKELNQLEPAFDTSLRPYRIYTATVNRSRHLAMMNGLTRPNPQPTRIHGLWLRSYQSLNA